MEQHGADAVRLFMLASGSPWSARRVGDATLQEIVRKVLLTYWNSVSFHTLYARTAGWTPAAGAPDVDQRHVLDRWLVSETRRLVQSVTDALENFDTQRAGQLLSAFVDGLSNWYVRRSRRRFWSGDPGALATLHASLDVLTRLLAPLTPFITERVWQDVIRPVTPDAPESVHLVGWPVPDPSAIDDELSDQVALARRLVELGRAARSEAKVRTRQPLSRALIGSHAYAALSDELCADIAEELNVTRLESFGAAGDDLVEYAAKGNFRALGKRFGKRTPVVAKAIADAEAAELAAALRDGAAAVEVEGELVYVEPDEVIISERSREGWSVINDQGETIALDLGLTPELVRAGLARELVRQIQEARKTSGLEVSNRITVWWQADRSTGSGKDLVEALAEHSDAIAEEVLATSMINSEPDGELPEFRDADLGLRFWLIKRS
jgi:isoleucyl-tRNA synthetase